jgi:hypothetical protein
MENVKIVVRFGDGRVIKGSTRDFSPNKPLFHLYPYDTNISKDGIEIFVKDLKAIFFVRDFEGNAQYKERKQFLDGERPSGRMVQITFTDGEALVGTTLGYDPKRPGFFLFPADSEGNNIRVFAVSKAIRTVRYL